MFGLELIRINLINLNRAKRSFKKPRGAQFFLKKPVLHWAQHIANEL